MILAKFYNNLAARHKELEPKINTIANHLIVIYAFALPVLIQVRRASLFLLLLLFIFRGHYYKYFSSALKDPLIRAFFIYFLCKKILDLCKKLPERNRPVMKLQLAGFDLGEIEDIVNQGQQCITTHTDTPKI